MSEKNQQHKSKIGGQALIEGIMMNGVKKGAMACRLPNGEIDVEIWDKKTGYRMVQENSFDKRNFQLCYFYERRL